MPAFGRRSLAQLATCHHDLRLIFGEVVKDVDCTIMEGHRGQVAQDAAFDRGASKLRWPEGKHNALPSMAVDAAPYPIDLSDRPAAIRRACYFAGYVMATAAALGVPLRWGGDWDSDWDLSDQTFFDLVHFELVNP
jgi:peptidoglycan L-alanyl-D-glutamate endopeptidase CwlK